MKSSQSVNPEGAGVNQTHEAVVEANLFLCFHPLDSVLRFQPLDSFWDSVGDQPCEEGLSCLGD
jgi:hypothetical protein